MASIFSRIIAGEIPSYRVAEDADNYAFLDINPLAEGHVLVVPKAEVDYIFDLSDKQLALAVGRAFPCRKVAQVVLGLEVPHAHIHLIPMNSEADVDFRSAKLSLPAERMTDIAAKIAAQL